MRNENIKERLDLESIAERCRKARLRWFGHVKRRDQLQFCTSRPRTRGLCAAGTVGAGFFLVGKRVQEVWEKKRKKGKKKYNNNK